MYSNMTYTTPLDGENVSVDCNVILTYSIVVNDSIKVCISNPAYNDSIVLIFSSFDAFQMEPSETEAVSWALSQMQPIAFVVNVTHSILINILFLTGMNTRLLIINDSMNCSVYSSLVFPTESDTMFDMQNCS